jgi:hypothetical protein
VSLYLCFLAHSRELSLPPQLCALYYYVRIIWLPNFGGYTIVEEVEELDDGARVTRLTRRYQSKQAPAEEETLLASYAIT